MSWRACAERAGLHAGEDGISAHRAPALALILGALLAGAVVPAPAPAAGAAAPPVKQQVEAWAPDHAETGSAEAIAGLTSSLRLVPPTVAYVPDAPEVPSPARVLGHVAGDAALAGSAELADYFRQLAAATPRVRVQRLGVSEEGREIQLVLISAAHNLAELAYFQEAAARLADPRRTAAAEAARLAEGGKVLTYVVGGRAAGDLASPEMLAELAYRLAVSERPDIQSVREDAIVLVTPLAEPDAYDRAVDWYRRQLAPRAGLPWESLRQILAPPYAGHYGGSGWAATGDTGLGLASTRAVAVAFFGFHPQLLTALGSSAPLLSLDGGREIPGAGTGNPLAAPVAAGEKAASEERAAAPLAGADRLVQTTSTEIAGGADPWPALAAAVAAKLSAYGMPGVRVRTETATNGAAADGSAVGRAAPGGEAAGAAAASRVAPGGATAHGAGAGGGAADGAAADGVAGGGAARADAAAGAGSAGGAARGGGAGGAGAAGGGAGGGAAKGAVAGAAADGGAVNGAEADGVAGGVAGADTTVGAGSADGAKQAGGAGGAGAVGGGAGGAGVAVGAAAGDGAPGGAAGGARTVDSAAVGAGAANGAAVDAVTEDGADGVCTGGSAAEDPVTGEGRTMGGPEIALAQDHGAAAGVIGVFGNGTGGTFEREVGTLEGAGAGPPPAAPGTGARAATGTEGNSGGSGGSVPVGGVGAAERRRSAAGARTAVRAEEAAWPPGGRLRWSLRDSVNYGESATLEVLVWAAAHREELLAGSWGRAAAALQRGRGEPPYAWIFPPGQADPGRLAALVQRLRGEQIEVHQLSADVARPQGIWEAGSYVVRLDQPYRDAVLRYLGGIGGEGAPANAASGRGEAPAANRPAAGREVVRESAAGGEAAGGEAAVGGQAAEGAAIQAATGQAAAGAVDAAGGMVGESAPGTAARGSAGSGGAGGVSPLAIDGGTVPWPILYDVVGKPVDDAAILDAPMVLVEEPGAPAGGIVGEDGGAVAGGDGPGGSGGGGAAGTGARGADEVFLLADRGQTELVAARLALASYQVDAAERSFRVGGREYPAGSWIVQAPRWRVEPMARRLGLTFVASRTIPEVARHVVYLPRIGVLHGWAGTEPSSWVRWTLDRERVPYTLIADGDLRRGGLRERFDVILAATSGVAPPAWPWGIDSRWSPLAYSRGPGSPSLGVPDGAADITGGPGEAGMGELRSFVEDGGVLATFGDASAALAGSGFLGGGAAGGAETGAGPGTGTGAGAAPEAGQGAETAAGAEGADAAAAEAGAAPGTAAAVVAGNALDTGGPGAGASVASEGACGGGLPAIGASGANGAPTAVSALPANGTLRAAGAPAADGAVPELPAAEMRASFVRMDHPLAYGYAQAIQVLRRGGPALALGPARRGEVVLRFGAARKGGAPEATAAAGGPAGRDGAPGGTGAGAPAEGAAAGEGGGAGAAAGAEGGAAIQVEDIGAPGAGGARLAAVDAEALDRAAGSAHAAGAPEKGATAHPAEAGDGRLLLAGRLPAGSGGEGWWNGRAAIVDVGRGRGHWVAFDLDPFDPADGPGDLRLIENLLLNWHALPPAAP